ncbi:unnamed protein product, partial [Brassica oleracea var. botrytis]
SKPHVNVGTIGHVEHGKTTLTAAITKREKLKLLPLMKLIKLSKPMFLLQSDSNGQSMLRFDLGMILIATDEFSAGNKLGQGGFGSVYKGILPSRQEIAVKRLAGGSRQGDLEFKNEVLLLTRLQHRKWLSFLASVMTEMKRFLFMSMSLIQVLITLYSMNTNVGYLLGM